MIFSRNRLVAGVVALFMLGACKGPGDHRTAVMTDGGRSSGLASTRLVTSLSPSELLSLCNSIAVPAGTTSRCDGGFAFTPPAPEDCATFPAPPAGCAATVGNVQACFAAAAANACTAFTSPACAPVIVCGTARP